MYLPAVGKDRDASVLLHIMIALDAFEPWQVAKGHYLDVVRERRPGPDHVVTSSWLAPGGIDPWMNEGMRPFLVPPALARRPFGVLGRWWPFTWAVVVMAAVVFTSGILAVLLGLLGGVLIATGIVLWLRGRLPYRPAPAKSRASFIDEWEARMAAAAILSEGRPSEAVIREVQAQSVRGTGNAEVEVPEVVRHALRVGPRVLERVEYLCAVAESDIRDDRTSTAVQSEALVWRVMTNVADSTVTERWPEAMARHAQACRDAGWCTVLGCRRPALGGDRCPVCDSQSAAPRRGV